jgi:hypothetical protein
VACHNHQQHAQRHDHDIAVLQNKVGHIYRFEQNATSAELEEHHDRQQREQQGVIAVVPSDLTADIGLGWRLCRNLGHLSLPMIS